ncbi:MAG: hypothetical protein GY909_05520 [Oligoflexia bacterium]|nr:hypothetical protein [Oligoflexia bacterium]
MKKILLTFSLLCFLVSPVAKAQAAAGSEDILQESMRDILTVAAMGTAGAVLGLSTLSFVEEPKDHLKNIVVGGAVGIIIGVGIVAWQQATKSQNLYESGYSFNPKDFNTKERLSWHKNSHSNLNSFSSSPVQVGYNFTF